MATKNALLKSLLLQEKMYKVTQCPEEVFFISSYTEKNKNECI